MTKETLFEQIDEIFGDWHGGVCYIGKERENQVKEILEKAINYNRCSTQLKEFDSDNFEDWIIVNGYAVFDDYYLKNDIAFSESDLIDIYNKEIMNL